VPLGVVSRPALDAELVPFRIRHDNPASGFRTAAVVHNACAEVEQPDHLSCLVRIDRQQVQVHPVLDRLLSGTVPKTIRGRPPSGGPTTR
jgi:hypothetical protein